MEALDLPASVISEDGKTYTIDAYQATVANVNFLWHEAARYDFLFSDTTHGDPERFVRYLLSPQVLIALVTCDETPVGIVYADQFREGVDARVHYLFWDKQQVGRQRLILWAIRWFLREFDLHRANVEVPVYAFTALRAIRRMGFRIEGRRREAILWRGGWKDVLLFGVIIEELTDEVLAQGKLRRTAEEADWFGVFSSDEIFRIALVKE